jgi:GDP-L-fucose synthase
MARPILFLTGGTGLVGRNLREHPEAEAYELIAPSSAELDLRDPVAVANALAEVQPDLVVHAAGRVGGIHANMAAPIAFLDDNLMIGRNVVIGARQAGVKRLINLGSTCIYPAAAPNPLREEAILTGSPEPTNEGYALAKLAVLKLCSYVSAADPALHYKTLIPCNLYGRHDHFHAGRSHLIAAIFEKVHHAKKSGASHIEVWGDGSARREFMYAGDLASAIFTAAARIEDVPDLMNVGVGQDHNVADYYRAVAKTLGWRGELRFDLSRPVGMVRKLADISRLRAFGWRAQVTLREGLERTAQYYLAEVAA